MFTAPPICEKNNFQVCGASKASRTTFTSLHFHGNLQMAHSIRLDRLAKEKTPDYLAHSKVSQKIKHFEYGPRTVFI